MFRLLLSVLQAGLQPLALVRRSLRNYSLLSQERVTSLVLFPSQNEEFEDTSPAEGEMVVADSCPADTAEIPGVCWRFARHGSNILQTSLAESQTPDIQSQAFSRQLYLDATAYLLQGLPPDLSEQDKLHLINALPVSLKESNPSTDTYRRRTHERNPSLLHRGLASTIIILCLLLRLALPYIKLFAETAYSYDRAHHIRERVFAFSITVADSLGEKSVSLASTAMTNEVILGAVTYWIDGIRGGLNEGLDQGLKVIESQNGP